MPTNTGIRVKPGMDLSARLLWYLAWHRRPLYIAGAVLAVAGAVIFHSVYGFLFGLVILPVGWKAASFVNRDAQRIIDLAKKAVMAAGASRVGVELESCECKAAMIGQSDPRAPLGVRAKTSYRVSAVYICDSYFAIYAGTCFSLPDFTLHLATTGDEVYFRHVSAINHEEGSLQVTLTRGNKPKTIAIGADPDGAALLQALRVRLRKGEPAKPEQPELQTSVPEAVPADAAPLTRKIDDGQRYCYIRLSKLMEYYNDPTMLAALMDQLEVPGLAATHRQMGEQERKAAIEAQIDHFRQTPSSFWYGVPAHEVLAASIWRTKEDALSKRLIKDKFYDVAREEDLRRPVARWLESRGEEPYMEIQLGRRRIDVLGLKKTRAGAARLTAVELKNDDEQFRRGPDQMGTFAEYAHAVYLACTPAFAADYLERNAEHRSVSRWDPTLLDRKLKQGGFGLLIVEREKVFEVIEPVERTPAEERVTRVVSGLPALHKIELD